jgi:quercetin dioxygenase-like cupin family protein
MPFRCDQPAVPTVQQDDATVRITRWDFAVGAATGWHTHGWPYFVVMLTDAIMKIEANGAVSEVRLAAGQSYLVPSLPSGTAASSSRKTSFSRENRISHTI